MTHVLLGDARPPALLRVAQQRQAVCDRARSVRGAQVRLNETEHPELLTCMSNVLREICVTYQYITHLLAHLHGRPLAPDVIAHVRHSRQHVRRRPLVRHDVILADASPPILVAVLLQRRESTE